MPLTRSIELFMFSLAQTLTYYLTELNSSSKMSSSVFVDVSDMSSAISDLLLEEPLRECFGSLISSPVNNKNIIQGIETWDEQKNAAFYAIIYLFDDR